MSTEAGRAGTGADGVPLYTTAHVNNLPQRDLIWHSRGGRWAQGLPTATAGKNLHKIFIRIPKRAITRPEGAQYLNKSNVFCNTTSAAHIDDVFADRNNIQYHERLGPGGRVAYRSGGTGAWVVDAVPKPGEKKEEKKEEEGEEEGEDN